MSNEGWVKIPSKSRPGRFYLYNVETGESKWCPSQDNNAKTVNTMIGQYYDIQPLNITGKSLRNPAQNRLKRLQHQLRSEQDKNLINRPTRRFQRGLNKNDVEEIDKDLPSTSIKSAQKRNEQKSPNKNNKFPRWQPVTPEKRKLSSLTEEPKKLPKLQGTKSTNANALPTTCNTTLSTLGTGFVNKIKEIWKKPFTSKKVEEDKAINEKGEKSSVQTETVTEKEQSNDTELKTAIENALKDVRKCHEKQKSLKPNTLDLEHNCKKVNSSANGAIIEQGSANARLQRLRQSLSQQPSTSSIPADALTVAAAAASSLKTFDGHFKAPGNRLIVGAEPMDWQCSIKQETIEISDSNDSNVNNASTTTTCTTGTDNNLTMADYYDTVNENLLRMSMEMHKELSTNKKWLKRCYYFILDTNVLLQCLSFVEDLSKMKLCDTEGTILYVPYCVLQELDKLKQGYGKQEGVKTLAVRAIKYLNNKFETKSPHLLAQSALEEGRHLIKVQSADDSIINCCLQVKEHIDNIVLLTEDINLRNKAICNGITVSTKSYLVSKPYCP